MHGKDFNRAQRVGDQIQRELGEIMSRAFDDPRAVGVTLSGVDVSPDLRNARVYLTMPEGVDPAPAVKALGHAAGYLRRQLAKRMQLRRMPSLVFVHDATLEQATRVSLLIDSVIKHDADPDDSQES